MPDTINTAVVKRDDTIDQEVTAKTPASVVADIRVKPMSIAYAVFVRCARVYVQGLLGFMTAGGLGIELGLEVHETGALFVTAAKLACAPVVFTFLQNLLELLSRLDEQLPRFRA